VDLFGCHPVSTIAKKTVCINKNSLLQTVFFGDFAHWA